MAAFSMIGGGDSQDDLKYIVYFLAKNERVNFYNDATLS